MGHESYLARGLEFVALVLSLSVHEAAHAAVAAWRGDQTARQLGRLTLNPIVHMDPVGTVALPLFALFLGGPFFGWAKPVPVLVSQLRWPRFDHLLVSFAGPISNLLLGGLVAGGAVACERLGLPFAGTLFPFAMSVAWINFTLAVFNAIPIPPLDGASILTSVLPQSAARGLDRLGSTVGFIVLAALAASGRLHFVSDASRKIMLFVVAAVGELF